MTANPGGDDHGGDARRAGPPGRAGAAERSAARLLRWYPAGWRSRYGEEFTELLLAEVGDRPRDWRRTADVIASGLVARLTAVGLTGHVADPADQVRACLSTLGCAAAVFLAFGLAMLAQLALGWQWAAPSATGTTAGLVTMSAAAAALALLAVAGLSRWPVRH